MLLYINKTELKLSTYVNNEWQSFKCLCNVWNSNGGHVPTLTAQINLPLPPAWLSSPYNSLIQTAYRGD